LRAGEAWSWRRNLRKVGATNAWELASGEGIVVAIIDTGVNYLHEDLKENMWRNPGETGFDSQGRDKATNGIDDDGNGYSICCFITNQPRAGAGFLQKVLSFFFVFCAFLRGHPFSRRAQAINAAGIIRPLWIAKIGRAARQSVGSHRSPIRRFQVRAALHHNDHASRTGDGEAESPSADSEVRWRFSPDLDTTSIPSVGPDGTVYVAFYDNSLYALDATGTPKWHYTASGSIRSCAAVASDGTI
jgi:subtilisin family serine protease